MISGSSHLLLRIPATEKRILTHRIFLVDVGSCYPQERPALKNALLRVDCLFFRISCEHCERFFVSSHCQLRIYNMFISIRHFIAFLLLSVTFLLSSCAVPDNFETSVKTQGAIERTYLARGKYAVGYFESATKEAKCGKFEVYYPTNAPGMRFPVIVIANGTGVKASAYSVVLKHYASWGFIIIGNEQENSCCDSRVYEVLSNSSVKLLNDHDGKEACQNSHPERQGGRNVECNQKTCYSSTEISDSLFFVSDNVVQPLKSYS